MLDQLAFADPLLAVDSDVVARYVAAVKGGTVDASTGVLTPGASAGSTGTGSKRISAELELIRALREVYSNSQLLDFGLATKDGNKLEIHLASYFATKSETVHRIPVINQAYSLADLSQSPISQLSEATDLRTAEANILYEAMTTDFMAIATQPSTLKGSSSTPTMGADGKPIPGSGAVNQQDTAARLQAAAKVPSELTAPDRLPDSSMSFTSLLKERDWKAYQDALRGMAPAEFDRDALFTALTESASSVTALYGGDVEALMNTPEMQAARANFEAAVGDLDAKADKLRTHISESAGGTKEESYVDAPESPSFSNDSDDVDGPDESSNEDRQDDWEEEAEAQSDAEDTEGVKDKIHSPGLDDL
jgi:hypothetical protein